MVQFKKLNISGLFPPIPTPFLENEDIDYDSLKKNVEKWITYDFAGTTTSLDCTVYDLLNEN